MESNPEELQQIVRRRSTCLQNFGYNINTVDAILNFHHRGNEVMLEKYKRIQGVFILIDIRHQLDASLICRHWHDMNQSKLDDFRREAMRMCTKVKRFCETVNRIEAAALFDKSFLESLQQKRRSQISRLR